MGRPRHHGGPRRFGPHPASALGASSYPDFVAASTKPPGRGGILTRTTAWDPPLLDPRLTNSVGLFQIYSLTANRMVRYTVGALAIRRNGGYGSSTLARLWIDT